MPVLSHLHQLFNAEQCQASIHTLRWKGRCFTGVDLPSSWCLRSVYGQHSNHRAREG